jgi:hypothetical protein
LFDRVRLNQASIATKSPGFHPIRVGRPWGFGLVLSTQVGSDARFRPIGYHGVPGTNNNHLINEGLDSKIEIRGF